MVIEMINIQLMIPRRLYVVWLIYASIVTYIITYRPLMVLSLILCFVDARFLYITIICMMLECCWSDISYYFLQRNSLKDFKSKIKYLKGGITPLNSELINEYIKKAIEIETSIFLKDFPPQILVYRLPRYCPGIYTYPVYPRTIFIFVKSAFKEREVIDRALLAHEMGHAFHAKYRNKKYLILISVCFIQLLLLLLSVFYNYWGAFLLTLPGNIYLLYVSCINYEANIETEADLTALKVIELLEGNKAMKTAAFYLMKLRIAVCRAQIRNNSKKSTKVFLASIWGLCPFISYEERKDILVSQNKLMDEINQKDINSREQKVSVMFEKRIRKYLLEMPYFSSALEKGYWGSCLFVLSVTVSLVVSSIALHLFFLNPNHLDFFFYRFHYSSCIIVLLLIFIDICIYLLKIKLWKQTDVFINQNGL